MTAQVARLALPFTDADIATADVRIENTTTLTLFTITLALPSVDGVSGGYYNGGDLGDGTFGSYATPNESLVMAFVNQIGSAGILQNFPITVTEDPLLPGRYVMTRTDAGAWKILWDDALTTMPSQWLGFDEATYTSTASVITAPWQSDRLWRATRPTWNRQREHKKTSLAKTWSGGISTRQLSDIRIEWQLKYSAQVGARIYKYDGTQQPLVDVVPGMALGDPNLALESLWQWIAARTPVEYWADEDDLTTSEYLRPREAAMLDGVIRNINAERSSAPPVYDIVMEFVTSTAGAVGTGGGGVICPPAGGGGLAEYDTYDDLPTTDNGGTPPDNGAYAAVTTTAAAGVYNYAATMGAIHPGTLVETLYVFDQWLPAEVYVRGVTYVVDTNGLPCRASMGIGGDDKAALLARGWADATAGSGTVTDGVGHLILQTGAGSGVGALSFAPIHSDTKVYIVSESSPITAIAGKDFTCAMLYQDGQRYMQLFMADNGVLNAVKWGGVGTVGGMTQTAFQRILINGSSRDSTTDSKVWEGWLANVGRAWGGGIGAVRTQFSGTAGVSVFMYDSNSGASVSESHWKELHAIKVAG